MRVEDMPAGPQMDALIESAVFKHEVAWAYCRPDPECSGWYISHDQDRGIGEWHPVRRLPYCSCDPTLEFEAGEHIGDHTIYCYEPAPEYSTDIATVWQVVEKMKTPYWESSGSDNGDFYFYFETENSDGESLSKTLPQAICRAALLACGVTEVPDDPTDTLERNRKILHGDGSGEI